MDLISIAIPGFWASMGYEAWWLKRRAQQDGPSPVDYELKDTVASLAMGTGSLVGPHRRAAAWREASPRPSGNMRKVLAVAAAAASAATVIDGIRRAIRN